MNTTQTQTRKITLHTAAVNGGPFNCAPAGAHELSPEAVLCNDVTLPGEHHPYGMRLFVIGNEFGAVCAVWATHDAEALDVATDAGLMDSFLVPEEDRASMTDEEHEQCAHLGNAGEPANLDYAWVREVEFVPARDWKLLCKFAEARGANADNLDNL